jgi:hypothetical protein
MPYVGLAPSDHEIMAHRGVAVRAAYQHVRALQRKGVFSSAPHHCNIRLSPEHVPPAGLPIIGHVVAGGAMLTVMHLARDPELHRLWRCGQAHSSCVSREPAGWNRRPTGEMTGSCAPSHGLSTGPSARVDAEVTVKMSLHWRTGLWLTPEAQQQGSPLLKLPSQLRIYIVS